MIGENEFGQGQYNWIDMGSSQELRSSLYSDSINIKPKYTWGEKRYLAVRPCKTGKFSITLSERRAFVILRQHQHKTEKDIWRKKVLSRVNTLRLQTLPGQFLLRIAKQESNFGY